MDDQVAIIPTIFLKSKMQAIFMTTSNLYENELHYNNKDSSSQLLKFQ